jgi:hypothetical protein
MGSLVLGELEWALEEVNVARFDKYHGFAWRD